MNLVEQTCEKITFRLSNSESIHLFTIKKSTLPLQADAVMGRLVAQDYKPDEFLGILYGDVVEMMEPRTILSTVWLVATAMKAK